MSAPHPGTREYRNQVVRLADLTVNTDLLEDLRFENCTIIGPAVIAVLEENTLAHNSFSAPGLNELFWLVPPDRPSVVGAIGVRRTEFYSCNFQRVGLAGPPELLEALRAGWRTS